jgi:hypothetical protein
MEKKLVAAIIIATVIIIAVAGSFVLKNKTINVSQANQASADLCKESLTADRPTDWMMGPNGVVPNPAYEEWQKKYSSCRTYSGGMNY